MCSMEQVYFYVSEKFLILLDECITCMRLILNATQGCTNTIMHVKLLTKYILVWFKF